MQQATEALLYLPVRQTHVPATEHGLAKSRAPSDLLLDSLDEPDAVIDKQTLDEANGDHLKPVAVRSLIDQLQDDRPCFLWSL